MNQIFAQYIRHKTFDIIYYAVKIATRERLLKPLFSCTTIHKWNLNIYE